MAEDSTVPDLRPMSTSPRPLVLSNDAGEDLLGKLPWQILTLLYDKPYYIKELAEETHKSEQAIYYHIRRLEDKGLVVARQDHSFNEKTNRTVVRNRYHLPNTEFVLSLSGHDEPHFAPAETEQLPSFLQPFNLGGEFDGYVVVGNPTRHGNYDAGATDGHFAATFTFFLGQFLSCPMDRFTVKTDTEMQQNLGENLVVFGGPRVNTILQHMVNDKQTVNDLLPAKYLFEKEDSLLIQKTGEVVQDPMLGAIQLITNPWAESKWLLIIGGPKRMGSKAAVVALTRFGPRVEEGFLRNGNYCLVRGKTDEWNEIVDVEVHQS